MKKIIGVAVLLVSLLCTACGGGKAAAINNTDQSGSAANNKVQLHIQAGTKSFTAEIERNIMTERLLNKVPYTLEMRPLKRGNLIYGDEPINMPKNLTRGLKQGDLAYCAYGYFIIFTGDQPAEHQTGFIKVGEIVSDNVKDLEGLSDGAEVTLSLGN